MGSMSIWHWIIVLAVGLLLFGGRGKISETIDHQPSQASTGATGAAATAGAPTDTRKVG